MPPTFRGAPQQLSDGLRTFPAAALRRRFPCTLVAELCEKGGLQALLVKHKQHGTVIKWDDGIRCVARGGAASPKHGARHRALLPPHCGGVGPTEKAGASAQSPACGCSLERKSFASRACLAPPRPHRYIGGIAAGMCYLHNRKPLAVMHRRAKRRHVSVTRFSSSRWREVAHQFRVHFGRRSFASLPRATQGPEAGELPHRQQQQHQAH